MNRTYPSVFTTQEAAQHGVSRRVLKRNNNINQHSQGLRFVGNPDVALIAEKICELTKDIVISHHTAAKVHGLRIPNYLEKKHEISVLKTHGKWSTKRQGVVGYRTKKLLDDETQPFGSAYITTVERTIFDLAQYLAPYQLIQVVDGAINSHAHGYYCFEAQTSIEKIRDLCLKHPGERGVKKLKLCLERARVGSDSAQETLLRLLLDDHGIHGLLLNHPVYSEDGELLFQSDLADERTKTSIQYEGEHHSEQLQVRRDIRRERRTEDAGWTEIRIMATDLYEEVFDADVQDWMPRAVSIVRRVLKAKS